METVIEFGQSAQHRVSTPSVVAARAVVVICFTLFVTRWPRAAALWEQKLAPRPGLDRRPSVPLWLPSWQGAPGSAASEGEKGAAPLCEGRAGAGLPGGSPHPRFSLLRDASSSPDAPKGRMQPGSACIF